MASAIQAPLRLGEMLFEASRAQDGSSGPQPAASPPHWPGAAERQEADSANLGQPPYLHDPRPDLESDSALWQQLLRAALTLDGEKPDGVFARLHCCRCLGGRLFRSAASGYRIQPDEGYLDGAKGWHTDRAALLAPEQAAIAGLVKGLRT